MNTNFGRISSIKIGQAGSLDAINIINNRVSFSVDKVSDKASNKATIRIYNLSQNTRNKLNELDNILVLEAGYTNGAGLETIFVGNIINVTHSTITPDVITVVQAIDGHVSLRDKNVALTFAAGTKAEIIFDKMANLLSLPFTKISEIFGKESFANAFSFAGPISDGLTKVTEKLGLEWSIRNNELLVVKKGETDSEFTPLITPASGLVGSPQKLDDIRKGSKDSDKKPGWRIICKLRPSIEPSSGIVIQSKEIPTETLFRVETVNHIGDNFGSDWNTIAVVSEIK